MKELDREAQNFEFNSSERMTFRLYWYLLNILKKNRFILLY